MRLSLVPLLAALCLPNVWGQEADTAPTETPIVSQSSPEDLLGRLPQSETLVSRDGAAYWDNGQGAAYKIAAVEVDGSAKLETEIGQLAIPRSILDANRSDALALLPKLVAAAQAGGLKAADTKMDSGLAMAEGIMTGIHLRSDTAIVLPEGVLTKQPAPGTDRKDEISALQRCVADLRKGIAPDALETLARKAVDDILARLDLTDTARKFAYDEVLPSFARRVARSGWARSFVNDKPLAQKLEDAIAQCEAMQPVTLYTGKGLRLAEVKSAFGQGGWILETPTRTSFARPHPGAMYAWGSDRWNLLVVVDLPHGSDPMKDGAKAEAARLFQGSTPIATWSRKEGFHADIDTWRKAVPDTGRGIEETTVTNFLPPHMVIIDLDGDVRLLVTEGGAVAPPRDTSTPEAERFLSDAAQALPDAAHLDLVGEYLFYYVYDSPDSRMPLVIGNKQVKGDIHQTAYQTLGTVASGVCRGDCDDLSELYQAILEHQGRTAHVITLPSHAACAYADKQGDDWHVYILQTGQPREFVDTKLQDALRKAYLSFDDSDNFDPNGLGLLLRFTGENTRGSWRLSWRIFSEPDYAKTMIDVQKDWHFSTYQRGIHKMEKLIADGDDDTANYRELSGLASFTGQHDLAVEYHRKALERTDDPESHLYAAAELVNHLFDAGKTAEARAEAEKLLNDELPKLKDQLGSRAFQFGFQLASVCSQGKAYDLAERTIEATMLKDMSEQVDQIAAWLSSPQFDKRRWESAEPLRRLQQMYIGTCLGVLEGVGSDGIAGNAIVQNIVRSTQTWLDRIAFHDVDEPDDVLARYATAAKFYEALLGKDRFHSLLADAPLATDKDYDHTQRVGGIAQVRLDLAWIKTTPTYWFGRLTEAVSDDVEQIDRKLVKELGANMVAAYENLTKLDIEDPWIDSIAHQGRLIVALISEDEPALRERLRFVTSKNDKRLRDDSAQWLGDVARFCSKDWYAKVLKAWVDECDYKPKYYWIAWRAALHHAPEQALMAADLAANRYKDDPAFQEEHAFMKALFAPKDLDKGKAKDKEASKAKSKP